MKTHDFYTRPPKTVDARIVTTFTKWHWLCQIKPLRKWLLKWHWMKITSTCHTWELKEGARVGEYGAVHWRVIDILK